MKGRWRQRALAVVVVGGAVTALLVAEGGAPRLVTRLVAQAVGAPSVRRAPGLRPDAALLFNGWGLSPAGRHLPTTDLPLKMVLSPDGRTMAAVHGGFNEEGVTLVDVTRQAVSQFLPLTSAWNGVAFGRDGAALYVAGGASGKIHRFRFAEGKATPDGEFQVLPAGADTFLAGLAVHPQTGRLYVCNEAAAQVLVLDPATGQLTETLTVGSYPHSLVFARRGRHLYVSNWGGRSVTLLSVPDRKRLREIDVGIRPNDMALAPDGRLFVACSGDNTIHVIDTGGPEVPEPAPAPESRPPVVAPEAVAGEVIEILSTSLYPASPEGSTPCGVAVSPADATLYVANADNNDVMSVDIRDRAVSRVRGFIPVGWYPSAVAVSADGRTLFVGNGKGLQFSPNVPAVTASPRILHRPPAFDYIGRILAGAIFGHPQAGSLELARYTEQVQRNSPYAPATLRASDLKSDGPIPDRVGAPCPIRTILYIIKENRTYDQVFGDFRDAAGRPAGNGDPRLVMFGETVTPNHHRLAREYVLLDNLYCNGEVSVDGHSWCDAAMATDYNERAWIQSYSRHGKLPGNREMGLPSAGFLWDQCRRAGLSYRSYGEGSWLVPTENQGQWRDGRDMNQVSHWIADLNEAERSGDLPRFTIMSLGEDHTRGTTPGAPTPDAAVGSNDVALGKIVAAASRSRFWREMAIFVIEDDAQNGPDHVDAHRTAGLVISPWCRRRFVDSTLYTTASMVRTMELILGLPPLTQYDAGATPMFRCFQRQPVLTAYQWVRPKVDLMAVNPSNAPGARQSSRMDFREYDRIPEDELNRILWRAVKGTGVPYPAPIHRAVLARRGEKHDRRP